MRMKKPDPFFGFMIVYLLLIAFQLFMNQILNPDLIDSTVSFLKAVSTASLTQLDRYQYVDEPNFLLIVITLLSSYMLLSYLLWYYWQLFGSKQEKKNQLYEAFKLTFAISIISICFLFLFFLYALSGRVTNPSFYEKSISALSLAVYSFANAGSPHLSSVFQQGLITQSFILQIGVVAGNTLGSMGIFVLYELLSPIKLRQRLADPKIDWSFITKVTVFGTAILFIIGSGAFYLMESNYFLKEKNIVESVIASVYEISSARGFGSSLSENHFGIGSKILRWFVSLIGSGPFSTGGGFTLLALVWIYSIIWKNYLNSTNTGIAKLISKKLIIYSIITFGSIFIIRLFINPNLSIPFLFSEQWQLFSTQQLKITDAYSLGENIAVGLTLIAGRIGFILACFLTLKEQKK